MFDHLAAIEHQHTLGDGADDAEIVGDEQGGQPAFIAQFPEQQQNLRSHGNIQRGHRLIGHQHRGIGRQRPGNANALALAAGKFMRQTGEEMIRRQADTVEQGARLRFGRRAAQAKRPDQRHHNAFTD